MRNEIITNYNLLDDAGAEAELARLIELYKEQDTEQEISTAMNAIAERRKYLAIFNN